MDQLEHATAQWHETNLRVGHASGDGSPPDPYLYAAMLEARAGWWGELAKLRDREHTFGTERDVYAIACSYAAELDRTDAAAVRFRYRIPTLHPGAQAERLNLGVGSLARICQTCGRPWQINSDGACVACPALLYGITPHNRAEADTYPPGLPWTLLGERYKEE